MSNTTVITGNLGNVPEIQTFNSGKIKATFSIASEVRDAQGNKTTQWHRISLWGKRAERAAQMLYKGAKVLVHGQEAERPYTDKNGESRVAVEFSAQNFYLLAKPVRTQA
ncbi:single-stranded DNA-binding protein [Geothrix sp. PMB-07]|uniref:single-stranded DNA-binding protein n=1 Tax=Geothrix sp. PMB-07 TaxID=3068640 RepID=UPI00274248EA|nr:single-stranded DNA-binding protein [Geothrix sp. PMB-07]WLT32756.1 single-stranded DNA-binding protein [Geothrix sp. PMB-07]